MGLVLCRLYLYQLYGIVFPYKQEIGLAQGHLARNKESQTLAQGLYTPRSHPITRALCLKPLFHSGSTSTPIPEPLFPLPPTPAWDPRGLQMGPELSRRLSVFPSLGVCLAFLFEVVLSLSPWLRLLCDVAPISCVAVVFVSSRNLSRSLLRCRLK